MREWILPMTERVYFAGLCLAILSAVLLAAMIALYFDGGEGEEPE